MLFSNSRRATVTSFQFSTFPFAQDSTGYPGLSLFSPILVTSNSKAGYVRRRWRFAAILPRPLPFLLFATLFSFLFFFSLVARNQLPLLANLKIENSPTTLPSRLGRVQCWESLCGNHGQRHVTWRQIFGFVYVFQPLFQTLSCLDSSHFLSSASWDEIQFQTIVLGNKLLFAVLLYILLVYFILYIFVIYYIFY